MRKRHRAMLIGAAALVNVVACVLFNLEGLRASYWSARAAPCGELTYGVEGLFIPVADAQRDATCFAQAASACRAVILEASATNVDSGASYGFIVEPPLGPLGACELAVTWNGHSIHSFSSGASACQRLLRAPNALRFTGCGSEGDITLPTKAGSYIVVTPPQ